MCKWEDPRPVTGDNHRDRAVQQVNQAPNAPFRLSCSPDPILFWVNDHADCTSASSRRHFLRYYTQTFTHLLTTNIENNSFLSGKCLADNPLTRARSNTTCTVVFLPMAMHSPPLLTSLIAWSSSHLSLRDTSFQQVAMQNRCAALRDLRSALDSDPKDVETNLAMSLVLCSLESIMADNGDAWFLHLNGAAGVIASKLGTEESRDGQGATRMLQKFEDAHSGRWLLRNFAYRDIVMSVARDQAPLLNSNQFLRLDEPRLPDSHFGLASEILEILYHTTALNEEVKATIHPASALPESAEVDPDMRPGPSAQSPEIMTRFLSLEARLTQWTCPPSTDLSLRLLAESYRSSALIHVYRVMRRAFPGQQDELSLKTTAQVAAIVGYIEQMPTRSLPECTLLFPLFLAGGEATEEPHIKCIRHRMLDMIESRGFRNVEVALSVLAKLWRLRIARKKADASVRVDWLDIVQQEGINLSLS